MNMNAVLAILVLKNVVTQDEANAVADYIHDRPQSTVLRDTIEDIRPLLIPPEPVMSQIGPVGPVQQHEEIAARAAAVPPPLGTENQTVTDGNGHHHLVRAEDTQVEQATKKPEHKPTKSAASKKSEDKPTRK
jgi:hypothetical protein